jgi:hydrogenase maturation protease
MTDVVVIGYGNELRGDDAVGPCVARAVASWQRPGLRALAVPQLTPELAETLRGADCVVFVDAAPSERIEVRGLSPRAGRSVLGHSSDPAELLALAHELYGCSATAWLIAVPAERFEIGDPLSPRATRGLREAVRQIADLFGTGGSS